jgi:hypothetical protein
VSLPTECFSEGTKREKRYFHGPRIVHGDALKR